MMINCPACERQVSNAAKSCPHCGHPLTIPQPTTPAVNTSDPIHVVGIAVAVIIVLWIAWYGVTTIFGGY